MQSILDIHSISKNYGSIKALDDVSFVVPQGSVFGILGPNGSGKTTLLGIVLDILKASSGSFELFGQPANEDVRKNIGTLLETPNFYHYLSGERNLAIAAAIKGKGQENISAVLQKVNLFERRKSKFSTYSLGMKQRLAIASALLADPELLVLDEPTNGLDPVGIAEIRELISALALEGKTIIMASHLLDEVEKVCTHVAVMKYGKLLVAGAVDEVLVNEDIVELSSTNLAALAAVVKNLPNQKGVKLLKTQVQVLFPSGVADLQSINSHCFDNGIILNHLNLKKKSLETKFLELTNN